MKKPSQTQGKIQTFSAAAKSKFASVARFIYSRPTGADRANVPASATPKPLPPRPAVSPAIIPEQIARDKTARELAAHMVAEERDRVTELTRIGAHAARLGVQFDLAKAIETGVKVQAARDAVLNAAAERDAETAINPHPSSYSTEDTNSKDRARAGFDRAIERVSRDRRHYSI